LLKRRKYRDIGLEKQNNTSSRLEPSTFIMQALVFTMGNSVTKTQEIACS